MKRVILANTNREPVKTYRNDRNPNKYVEVKKGNDGHSYIRQYMEWDTEDGKVKNYMGSKTNRGKYHRTTQETINQILEDYTEVIDNETENGEITQVISASKSYVYHDCRIYNTGNGFVVYQDNKAISPEFATADEAEEFVDDECSGTPVEAATLTSRSFHKFLRSKQAPRSLKSVAADLLYQWYKNEGASIDDITYEDVGEMANAADDDLDRATVFYAMGYWNSDDYKETLQASGFDEDEIASIMRGR